MLFERSLIPFPGTPAPSIGRVDVQVDWEGRSSIFVTFRISGFAGGVILPAPKPPERRDELWMRTCCEVFARRRPDDYVEFNLSPSGDWAAYAFSGYRAGMHNFDVSAPNIWIVPKADGFELTTFIPWSDWPHVEAIGLSVVVEATDGSKTYWALTHPSDMPDFHHADSFALISPVLEQP
jgi:hypothetical protein